MHEDDGLVSGDHDVREAGEFFVVRGVDRKVIDKQGFS